MGHVRNSRRNFLQKCAIGTGGFTVGAASLRTQLQCAAVAGELQPILPEGPHFLPKAKRLIIVFLTGGVSHLDTFDPKPQLTRDHGKTVDAPSLREVAVQPLQKSPFRFTRRGQSGLEISELFPQFGAMADDLCIIRSMQTDILEHFQAALAMHTGSATVPLPSIGAWLSYALKTDNLNLPPYIVLCEHLPYGGAQLWDAGFLPPVHQGARMIPGLEPIAHLRPAVEDITLRSLEAQLLDDFNNEYALARNEDLALKARTNSFHTARGMMKIAPRVLDFSDETDATHELYGLPRDDRASFAWQCLAARRLAENGVRVVEIIESGASGNWDAHGNMQDHRPKARRVDQALAGLLKDLKQTGMFDDTLVAVCTEFGRTAFDAGPGRNHWHRAFSCLLTGAGIRGGMTWGESDEYGIEVANNPVHVHDYHATILHLMGLDHERLTYRYAGRDFRLTDVAGNVIRDVLS